MTSPNSPTPEECLAGEEMLHGQTRAELAEVTAERDAFREALEYERLRRKGPLAMLFALYRRGPRDLP